MPRKTPPKSATVPELDELKKQVSRVHGNTTQLEHSIEGLEDTIHTAEGTVHQIERIQDERVRRARKR